MSNEQQKPRRKMVASSIRPITLKVAKQNIEAVGLHELAILSGKSKITLRQWETKGWLPMPNFRMPIKGKQTVGARLYTFETAKLMAEEIKKAVTGVVVPAEVKQRLHTLIKEERDRLKNNQNASA